MLVLGLDLETTGLDPQGDRIIELGAVVWDTEKNRPIDMINHLVAIGEVELSSEVTKITGIEKADLDCFGKDERLVLEEFSRLAANCSHIVAHNANFDRNFLERALFKYGMGLNKKWIDSLHDVPYLEDIKTRKLTYLAAEHGFLNPYSHRALFDVMAMLKLVSLYDWQEIFKLSESPTLRVKAIVSYEDRDKAKQAGFRWDAPNRSWIKDLKQVHLEGLDLPFELENLGPVSSLS